MLQKICLWAIIFICINKNVLSQSTLITNNKLITLVEKYTTDLQKNQQFYLVSSKTVSSQELCMTPGVKKIKKLSDGTFIMKIEDHAINTIEQLANEIYPVNNWWKTTEATYELFNANALEQKEVSFQIMVNDSLKAAHFFEIHKQDYNSIYRYNANTYSLEARKDIVKQQLLPATWVTFISHRVTLPKEEANVRALNYVPNGINQLKNEYTALNGENMVISVKENAFDTNDIDIKGRIIPSSIASEEVATHATQMASLLVGAGNTSLASLGIAPKAKVSSASFLQLFPDPADYYKNASVSVQNHSYGIGIENYYGAEAEAYDNFTTQAPDILHVFSAGNVGDLLSISGPYAGVSRYATITGNFKMAKNVLTVGALDTLGNIAARSSRGPAYDGRLKPELVAYGGGGTSDAAAMVSGTALLLQQAYKERFNELPEISFLKALLYATAQDIASPGIDYKSGYGNLQAKEVIAGFMANNFTIDSLQQGQENTYALSIPEGIKTVRIALAWNDPPADPGNIVGLVNDLDCFLVNKNTGEVWQPWILSAFPNEDSLALPAQRGTDRINPAELITVNLPSSGDYELHVSAHAVQSGFQSFSFAYHFIKSDTVVWEYPLKIDVIKAGSTIKLQWKNNTSSPIDLSVSVAGETYQLLETEIEATQDYYYLTLPDTATYLQIKLETGGKEYLSDTLYTGNELQMEVGFDCEEDFLLFWEKDLDAIAYEVLGLGDQIMEVVSTTTDTLIVLPKTESQTFFYAIQPIYSANNRYRSNVLKYNSQGVGCYVRNILARVNDEATSTITLNLGSLYGITEIQFEKKSEGSNSFKLFNTITSLADLNIELEDENLIPGVTTYRANIKLENGSVISTNETTVAYADENFFSVYPSPILVDEPFLVFSKVGNSYINLYDLYGKRVFRQVLTEQIEAVLPLGLIPGLYLCTITQGNSIKYQSKLLLQ